jgi:hypothetical protein
MKLYASVFAVVLAASCCMWAQNSSTAPGTPPTFPGHQTVPDSSMPQDQPAPPAARDDQNQGGATEMSNLSTRIQQAIASDSMLENSDVKAVVQGDQLLLTGTVSTQNAKDRAEQIAAPFATQNNLKVVNHIGVQL